MLSIQEYARFLSNILDNNKNQTNEGVKCLVTMELRKGVLEHAFVLVTKVLKTAEGIANGMTACKVIFKSDEIKRHSDIPRQMWRATKLKYMCLQPIVISQDGNIRSYVSIQDLREGNICWNQTCQLPQCQQAVGKFSGFVGAYSKAGLSAWPNSGPGVNESQDYDYEAPSDEALSDGKMELSSDEEDGNLEEVGVLLSDLSSETQKEEGGAGNNSQGRGREEHDGSDSGGCEIVDNDGGGNEDTVTKQRRQTRNSLRRGELEPQPDEIAAEAAKKVAEEGAFKKRESTVLCIDVSHSTLLCAPHVAESEHRAISVSMPNSGTSIFARVVCAINATILPCFGTVLTLLRCHTTAADPPADASNVAVSEQLADSASDASSGLSIFATVFCAINATILPCFGAALWTGRVRLVHLWADCAHTPLFCHFFALH